MPDDVLKIMPHTEMPKFKSLTGLEPALQHLRLAWKADGLTRTLLTAAVEGRLGLD